jgi:hypothetical protein
VEESEEELAGAATSTDEASSTAQPETEAQVAPPDTAEADVPVEPQPDETEPKETEPKTED